ncbi:hypothetical protein [Streptomyces chartreusis]|uniref:hypothetical protein n=1 Tax=Streptomyces chartreusis TaxID=1969 RepID=UPI00340DF7ED
MELIFPNDAEWTSYADEELHAWLQDLPAQVPEGHVFLDLRGKAGNHTPTCPYLDLPPIALVPQNIKIANDVRRRLWEIRQRGA